MFYVSYSVVKVLSYAGIVSSSGSLATQAGPPASLVFPPRRSNRSSFLSIVARHTAGPRRPHALVLEHLYLVPNSRVITKPGEPPL
jgi:hypothetical protein